MPQRERNHPLTGARGLASRRSAEPDRREYRLRRLVIAGYLVTLVLAAVVAGAAALSIPPMARRYERALQAEREVIGSVLMAQYEVRGAQIAHLRYLVDPDEHDVARRDSQVADARRLFERLRDDAVDAQHRETWARGLETLAAWEQASDHAIEARRDDDLTEALRIHETHVVGARDAQRATVLRGLARARQARDEHAVSAAQFARGITSALILGGLLAVAVGAASSFGLVRGVSRPRAGVATRSPERFGRRLNRQGHRRLEMSGSRSLEERPSVFGRRWIGRWLRRFRAEPEASLTKAIDSSGTRPPRRLSRHHGGCG